MTSQNYIILGQNDDIRARRFRILQLYLRNATPPEIAHSLGLELKQVYRDITFLRSIRLNDLPIEIIRDMGSNFFEMKVRELQSRVAAIPEDEVLKNSNYVLGLERLILQHKSESLKILGAYQDPDEHPTGPIQIIFEEVTADYGKDTAKRTRQGRQAGTGCEEVTEQEKEIPGVCDADEDADPEKEYPLY